MNKLIEIIKKEFQVELTKEPFHMLDLGCSGGISADWRLLEPYLRVIGIDLNVEEVEKLNKQEKNKAIKYHAGNLELSPDHPIRTARGTPFVCESHKIFAKTSAWDAHYRSQENKNPLSNRSRPDYANIEKILQENKYAHVDFIKIDVDGPDFDILMALESSLAQLQVLAFKLEVNFNGTTNPSDHTFHNMDRLMRKNGFELYDLSVRRYTKNALPGRFEGDFFGQTITGAVTQGDAVYFLNQNPPALSLAKNIKQITLMTLSNQIDSAAQLLLSLDVRESFKKSFLDTAALMQGYKTYRDLLSQWKERPESFFHKNHKE